MHDGSLNETVAQSAKHKGHDTGDKKPDYDVNVGLLLIEAASVRIKSSTPAGDGGGPEGNKENVRHSVTVLSRNECHNRPRKW